MAIALGFGFTVDDALISTRVAYHLNVLGQYSFNPEGPRVDSVTPLGWAWLIAPFASGGPWSGLQAARAWGIVCSLLSAACVGLLIARPTTPASRRPALALIIICVCLSVNLPFGAWAASGMETPLIMLLCTLAVLGGSDVRLYGFASAGVAAGLRPELLPWALALALLSPTRIRESRAQEPKHNFGSARRDAYHRLFHVVLVLCPPLLVMLLRALLFGSPTPLAVVAKPSDLTHGFVYSWGAIRLLGLPVLLLGLRAWSRVPAAGKATAGASLAHLAAVIIAGGDWMSLFRLFIPILPSLLWLAYLVLRNQASWAQLVKAALALVPSLAVQFTLGPQARNVWSDRLTLTQQLTPLVATSRSIGTLDVGWVAAATGARVTDFAGVTDPEIAHLPGGHTSKRLTPDLLERRQIDTLVLLLQPQHPPLASDQSWTTLSFARAVEARVARMHGADQFSIVARLSVGDTNQEYVVLRRL